MVSLSLLYLLASEGAPPSAASQSFMPFPNEDNCFPRSIPRGLSPSQDNIIAPMPGGRAQRVVFEMPRAPSANPRTTKKVKTWQKKKNIASKIVPDPIVNSLVPAHIYKVVSKRESTLALDPHSTPNTKRANTWLTREGRGAPLLAKQAHVKKSGSGLTFKPRSFCFFPKSRSTPERCTDLPPRP
jgi:hypothetical protein